MKRLVGLLVFALVLVSFGMSTPAAASTSNASAPRFVDGQYIITLKAGVSPKSFASGNGIATKYVYDKALNGFTAKLTLAQVAKLRANPAIERIEQDTYVTLAATQSGATWGIDRIDQANLPLSGTYTYNTTASNVNVYIIDTGIQTNHPQFGGRASVGYDALGGNGQDCNGHGTHVAGTVGGSTYGVAKGVRLYAVRVLNCQGSGTTSQIINGMNWVANNHRKPAVANMSLGGGANTSLDNAATNLVSRGVTVAVAAGNSNANASTFSPARASGVITVASSTNTDAKSSFSNYGSVVEVYAPGTNITSAWTGSTTRTISGTSMASPHVAGVAALYLAGNPGASPATVSSWIISNSIANKITGNPSGTPNRLLNKAGL